MPRRPIRALAILVTVVLAAVASAVPITFEVRMSHQITLGRFDPAVDVVDLAGTFNGWGADPLTPLADADGDTIYTVVVDGFTPGETIEFKFRLNGVWDGREEFPGGGPNRQYTVQADDNAILVWYGDEAPPDLGELAWWNDTVFYEIFVRSFHDSDGDGIGDLAGLTQKLDYLNDGDPTTHDDLGITGIWLMPVNDSPSYHGYDAVDYRTINPDYGTMADFTAFLDAAHARGIKVIVDFVMNHCSTQHPWFVASAQQDPAWRDWFRWSAVDPGYAGPWGQDVWHWHASGYYYGVFWGGMPDLNYEHPPVKTEMFETATHWLQTVGVDGFRLDAVLYILEEGTQLENTTATFEFWHDFKQHVASIAPDALTVGEAWTDPYTALNYVTDDRLDLCFEFTLAGMILSAAGDGNASGLNQTAAEVHGLYPYLQVGTFLSNHDQDRVLTVLGEDRDRAKVAAGIYLTLPGVPFVYYGEEIGLLGSGAHENIRRPMQWSDAPHAGFTTGTPWIAPGSNYLQANVADELEDPDSLLRWYQALIDVRMASPALRRGDLVMLASPEMSVLAFLRQLAGETVLVVANTGPSAIDPLPLAANVGGLAEGSHTLIDLLDGGATIAIDVDGSGTITGLAAGPREVAVYRLDGPTAVGPNELPSAGPVLHQNHPNPFNPATTISYTLTGDGAVRLSVHDVAGRLVAVLHDGEQIAGTHAVRWDVRDTSGRSVGAGVYLVRLQNGHDARVVKMLLVR
jgi:glycosidase